MDQEGAMGEVKRGQILKGEWTGLADRDIEDDSREPGKLEGWSCLRLRWEKGIINQSPTGDR